MMASNKFDSDASDNVHDVSSTSISFTDNSCPVSSGGTDTNQQTADTAVYNMQQQHAQQSSSNEPSANRIFENNIENLANDNIANTPNNISGEDGMYHSTSTNDHYSVSVQDTCTQDTLNNTNRDNTETTIASSSLQPHMSSTSIITPNHRRRNSRRTITQMESISETGHSVYEAANTSSSLSYTTPRRRRLRPHSTESASRRSSRSTESDTRRRRNRRYVERSNFFSTPDDDEIEENNDDSSSRRRRFSNNGNALVASLDAGMATLRRWINARRPSFGTDNSATGGGSSSGPNSVSSMTAMRLGEEDIFALSHTGSDQRTTLSDQNTSDGFLYYRPFEINVRDDVDVESALYASDDESGSTSRILHPLISSEYTESDHPIEEVPTSRQRAFSEPSRAHIREFISSVYGTRAIDSSSNSPSAEIGECSRHRESTSPSIQTSPVIIEEEIGIEQTERTNDTERNRISSSPSDSGQLDVSELELPDTIPPDNTLEVEPNDTEVEADGEIDPNTPSASADDPNAEARIRWIRINRRFKFMISSVALIFSLLLFCVLISWVLLATTYVVSNKKPCDVPLKQYFWLVSTQLLLDVFRADIMKWLCQWPHSHRRVPPRVILYNVAYVSIQYCVCVYICHDSLCTHIFSSYQQLIYAMLVLRLGIQSVFIKETTCSNTAPELFYSSLVFICLSLLAWATICLGYLIPFVFVAILLTHNGYFPNGELTSRRGVMGGRRTRIGNGRISGMVGEAMPNHLSNPSPDGTIDRLTVILPEEIPDSYQKECAICLMEYKEGEVILQTPCQHIFHKRCCNEWFQLSRTCPVCREDVPSALGLSEEGRSTSELPNFIRFRREVSRRNDGAVELTETTNSSHNV